MIFMQTDTPKIPYDSTYVPNIIRKKQKMVGATGIEPVTPTL